jgi:hypothetical protein
MVVSRMKREPNPSHVPPRAGFYLPVDIEGQRSLSIADTGANVSVISAAEARSLGLNVRSGSAAMTDISGAAVKVQVAGLYTRHRSGTLHLEPAVRECISAAFSGGQEKTAHPHRDGWKFKPKFRGA